MKPNRNITLLILMFVGLSCNSNQIFNEVYTFEDYSWTDDEKVIFRIGIQAENADNNYELGIDVRYITGFSYKYLNLLLLVNRPDGSQGTKEISIQMLTDNKEYRGDGMGDIWDLEYVLKENLHFKDQGIYEIEIKPLMGDQAVNFINKIGISLRKKEPE